MSALNQNNYTQNIELRGLVTESESPLPISVCSQNLTDCYNVEPKPFARGKFSTVRLCSCKTSGEAHAAKYIKKRRRSANARHEIIHEILILLKCKPCQRIIQLKEVFESPSEMVLVLELAEGGELQRLLDDDMVFLEFQALYIINQVLEALSFLHTLDIVHLDIKPQNILLTGSFPQCDIKLCDFGISRLVSANIEIRDIVGTPDYAAPEILQFNPISLATDMWSLGILTYALLSGHTPFGGETKQETFCNITNSPLDFPDQMFLGVSSHAKEFIKRLLVRNPRERMSSIECFQHPWVCTKSKEIPESSLNSNVEQMGGDSARDLNMNYTAKMSSPIFTQQDFHQTEISH